MAKQLSVRSPNNELRQVQDGTVLFEVKAFQDGDLAYQKPENLGGGNMGMSISQLRQSFGGDEGEIFDPFQQLPHPISLGQWADLDPDKTFLQFRFELIPASA